MSNKRVRGAPERYVSWEEGDKHAPMALRKKKQLNKAVKQTKLAYQQQYRAREEVKTAQKAYQKEYRERDAKYEGCPEGIPEGIQGEEEEGKS